MKSFVWFCFVLFPYKMQLHRAQSYYVYRWSHCAWSDDVTNVFVWWRKFTFLGALHDISGSYGPAYIFGGSSIVFTSSLFLLDYFRHWLRDRGQNSNLQHDLWSFAAILDIVDAIYSVYTYRFSWTWTLLMGCVTDTCTSEWFKPNGCHIIIVVNLISIVGIDYIVSYCY